MVFGGAGFRGALALGVCLTVWLASGCGRSANEARVANAGGEGGATDAAASEGGAPSSSAGMGAGQGGQDLPEGGAPAGAGPAAGEGGALAGGAGGESSAGQAGAPAEPAPAPKLTLRAISIYQTHELPLMQAGEAVPLAKRPAPLVAGKRALVRAFVDLEPGFAVRPLLGVLDVKTSDGTRTLLSERTISQSTLQDDLTTSFVFNVDGADIKLDSTYRVRVLEADTTPLARFPATGYLDLQAQSLPPFELVLVPLVSAGFGPLTGEAELSALRQRLTALYPSPKIDVTLAAPVTLSFTMADDDASWDAALDRAYQLRQAAAPAHDVFYYGMLAPQASFNTYCKSGCTLGYSNVAEETDVDLRFSIGVTVFQDGTGTPDAWDTMAHELGHAMGRLHAPCGDPDDPDPDYPYPGGGMGGVYGFDFDLMKLVNPKRPKDVMGYCSTSVWISDYTYRGIFDRLHYIAGESFRVLALAPPALFRLARIHHDGHSFWLDERRRSSTTRRAQLSLLDGAGRPVGSIEAQPVLIDHGRGSYVWLPSPQLAQRGAVSVDLRPLGGGILPI